MGDFRIPNAQDVSVGPSSDNVWAHEVQKQQSARKHVQKSTEAPEKKETPEKAYEAWYKAANGKTNVSFTDTYDLAQAYWSKYGDTKSFHNDKELRAVKDWLKIQNDRPRVELDLSKFKSSGLNPTPEQIGIEVARSLNFSDAEMALYAAENGSKTPGAAFYQSNGNEGNYFLKEAQKDSLGRVNLGEMTPGAISGLKKWLADYHERLLPNPILAYDWDKQRTLGEAIETHLAVPTFGFAGGLVGGVGDIVRGAGLPLHLFTNHTFMDSTADYLGKTSESCDLYALYTKSEQMDGGIAILNIYTKGIGGVAPMMVPGMVAGRVLGGAGEVSEIAGAVDTLSTAQKAQQVTGEIVGAAASSGQVYNAAITTQAREYAVKELKYKNPSEEEIATRTQEIKEGKNIDPNIRNDMELRALGSSAIAAPLGAVYGRWLSELGNPGAGAEESAFLTATREGTTGSIVAVGQTITNEYGQVITGVKTPDDANNAIGQQLPEAVFNAFAISQTMTHATARKVETVEAMPEDPGKPRLEDPSKSHIIEMPKRPEAENHGNEPECLNLRHVAQEDRPPRSDKPKEGSAVDLSSKTLEAAPDLAAKMNSTIVEWTKEDHAGFQYERLQESERRSDDERSKLGIVLDSELKGHGREMLDAACDDPSALAKLTAKAPAFKDRIESFVNNVHANEKSRNQLDQLVEQRRLDLEGKLNDFARANSLPPVQIIVMDDLNMKGHYASYTQGTGTINLRMSSMLGIDPAAKVIGSACHEFTHNEQEALLIRAIADDLHVGKVPTPEQKGQIEQAFHERLGGTLWGDRLADVMAARNGQPLSTTERARANKLQESFSDFDKYVKAKQELDIALKRVNQIETIAAFSSDLFLHSLADGISKGGSNTVTNLFGDKPIPPQVLELVDSYKKFKQDPTNNAFDMVHAGQIIKEQIFDPRNRELENQRQTLFAKYLDFHHEKEAFAVGKAVEENLPDKAKLSRTDRKSIDLLQAIFATDDEGNHGDKPNPNSHLTPLEQVIHSEIEPVVLQITSNPNLATKASKLPANVEGLIRAAESVAKATGTPSSISEEDAATMRQDSKTVSDAVEKNRSDLESHLNLLFSEEGLPQIRVIADRSNSVEASYKHEDGTLTIGNNVLLGGKTPEETSAIIVREAARVEEENRKAKSETKPEGKPKANSPELAKPGEPVVWNHNATSIDAWNAGYKLTQQDAVSLIEKTPVNEWHDEQVAAVMDNWKVLPDAAKEQFLLQFAGLRDEPTQSALVNALVPSNKEHVLSKLDSYGEDTIPPSMKKWFENQKSLRDLHEATVGRTDAAKGTVMRNHINDFAHDFQTQYQSLDIPEIAAKQKALDDRLASIMPKALLDFAKSHRINLRSSFGTFDDSIETYVERPDMAEHFNINPKELQTALDTYINLRKPLEPEIIQANDDLARCQKQVSNLVKQYADKLGIPAPNTVLAPNMQSDAMYDNRTNTIAIKTILPADINKLGDQIAHEVTHAEQSALVTRYLADSLGIVGKPTPEQRIQLEEKLRDVFRVSVDRAYITEALKQKTQPLSSTERARAESLAQSFQREAQDRVMQQLAGIRVTPEEYKSWQAVSKMIDANEPFGNMQAELEKCSKVIFSQGIVPDSIKHLMDLAKTSDPVATRSLYSALKQYGKSAEQDMKADSYGPYRAYAHEREAWAVGLATRNVLDPSYEGSRAVTEFSRIP